MLVINNQRIGRMDVGIQIDKERCSGCGRCMDICPGDLIYLDKDQKSQMRNAADCWDCMACVKTCPAGAIETKLPYSLAEFGAHLIPRVSETKICWECIYPDGRREEFVIPRC